jgi:hypothetical protein
MEASNTKPSVSAADPLDPYVFGPPGSASGSISKIYESGSGSLKNDVNVSSKSNKQKNILC